MPRPVAHLANLDLNLLVALRERSVTRAAERLGVTQPAASAALSRLRRHFGDELLIRDRGEYTIVVMGEALSQVIARAAPPDGNDGPLMPLSRHRWVHRCRYRRRPGADSGSQGRARGAHGACGKGAAGPAGGCRCHHEV